MCKKYQESMVLTTFYYVVTICYHQTLVVAGRFPLFEAVSLFSGLPLAGMDGVKCFSIYPSKVQTDPEDAMIGISLAKMGY